MTRQDIIDRLKDYFSHDDDIEMVLLYGSVAKGTFNPKSDIDIALYSKKELSFEVLAKIQTELAIMFDREIDVADLKKAEGTFLYQIMTNAVKIKFEENIYVRYAMKALYFYEDFLPILRRTQEEKLKRMLNG
ncbi:MAG: nucleotidyltransferase domain-containing protein [Treponema sp.]|nr:nucleotidyltransferase domain-containing protein [Treponema sp.]